MTELTVSNVASWKKPKDTILALPSGNNVRVFNPGMKTFLVNGTVPNSLMSLADKALQKGQPLEDGEVNDLINDPKKIADMLKFVDDITMAVVVEPKIYPTPMVGSERSDEFLYIDDMDDEDKLFIFTWGTGGSTDLERFRAELTGTLDDLQSGDNLEVPAV
jgi:hypothetical protein